MRLLREGTNEAMNEQPPFALPTRIDSSPSLASAQRRLVVVPPVQLERFRRVCKKHRATITEVLSPVFMIAQLLVAHRRYGLLDGQHLSKICGSTHYPMDGRRFLDPEKRSKFAATSVILATIGMCMKLLIGAVEESGALGEGKLTIGKVFWNELVPSVKKQWKEEKVSTLF